MAGVSDTEVVAVVTLAPMKLNCTLMRLSPGKTPFTLGATMVKDAAAVVPETAGDALLEPVELVAVTVQL